MSTAARRSGASGTPAAPRTSRTVPSSTSDDSASGPCSASDPGPYSWSTSQNGQEDRDCSQHHEPVILHPRPEPLLIELGLQPLPFLIQNLLFLPFALYLSLDRLKQGGLFFDLFVE